MSKVRDGKVNIRSCRDQNCCMLCLWKDQHWILTLGRGLISLRPVGNGGFLPWILLAFVLSMISPVGFVLQKC